MNKPYQFTPNEAAALIGCILILPFLVLAIYFVALRKLVAPTPKAK